MTDQQHRIITAIERASNALAMRREVASPLASSNPVAVLDDVDVRKSVDLLIKAATAAKLMPGGNMEAPTTQVRAILDDAVREMAGY